MVEARRRWWCRWRYVWQGRGSGSVAKWNKCKEERTLIRKVWKWVEGRGGMGEGICMIWMSEGTGGRVGGWTWMGSSSCEDAPHITQQITQRLHDMELITCQSENPPAGRSFQPLSFPVLNVPIHLIYLQNSFQSTKVIIRPPASAIQ